MAAVARSNSDEPAYKKWATVATAVVAAVSLCLNIVLGLFNLNLAQAKAASDQKLAAIDLENRRLDNLIKVHDNSVDLEARYLVVSGLAIFDTEGGNFGDAESASAIVQNQVLEELEPWKSLWGRGESPIEAGGGVARAHGVVYYRISNRGKEDAQRAVLTYRWKDFPLEGQSDDNLWELQTDGWKEDTVRLTDLRVGQSVVVPLAHVLGTNRYFGRVIMPSKIEWFNATLQRPESLSSTGMAPEDQWIYKSLNISVGQ